MHISDAMGDEHIFDATSDFPTAVGPAMTITNGFCCCSFSAENESDFSRFLEFIRSVVGRDRELKNAVDVLDGKNRMGLSI